MGKRSLLAAIWRFSLGELLFDVIAKMSSAVFPLITPRLKYLCRATWMRCERRRNEWGYNDTKIEKNWLLHFYGFISKLLDEKEE